MTDMLNREEVMEQANLVRNALTIPHNPNVIEQVRRFGFEYEMLTDDDEYTNVDEHMDNFDEYSLYHDPCNCEDCREDRREAERERFFEANRGGLAAKMIERAYNAGLIGDNDQHCYHCPCRGCSPTRSYPLLTAQEDSTCGVEFVSRILDFHDTDWIHDVEDWVALIEQWKTDGEWMPDGYASCGNHVHVSCDGDTDRWDTSLKQVVERHINAIYAVFDWNSVADGGCGCIRGYNPKPNSDGRGGWFRLTGYGTGEHRLWNTPCDPKRLWAHIGLSIGITRWAFALACFDPTFSFYEKQGYYGDRGRLTDETFAALTDNIGEVVRGIRSYIPTEPQFDIARQMILRLA